MAGKDWPLVGRGAELRFADDTLHSGSNLVLAGAAGVGKSRLASELAALQPKTRIVRTAVATASARSLPYGALAHLASETCPPQSFARELRSRAVDEEWLLLIDDVHHLDDHSAALTMTLAQSGIGLVLTLRSGEPAPDAVQALWKDGLARRIELQPLSGEETGELLARALGGSVSPSTEARFFEITAGNPLYLAQLVGAAAASGDLHQRGSVWRWTPNSGMNPELADLIGSEIRDLDDSLSDALELVAFAEPMEFGLLEDLVGSDGIAAIERSGIATVETNRRRLQVRLVHPLYAEYFRGHASVSRVRQIHTRLAAASAASPSRRMTDDLRRAVWLLESGGCDDLDLLLRAGVAARMLIDHDLVERLADAGLAAGGGRAFALGRAYARRWRGELLAASDLYDQMWATASDDFERTTVLNIHPTMMFFGMHREDDALAMLCERSAILIEPDCRILTRALEAMLRASLGERGVARAMCSGVLADAADCPTVEEPLERLGRLSFVPDARLYAASVLALIDLAEGDVAAAHRSAQSFRDLGVGAGPAVWLVSEWVAERCLRAWGDGAVAVTRAEEITAFCQDLHAGGAAGASAMIRGCSALGAGQVRRARTWFADAVAGLEIADSSNFTFHVAIAEAEAAALSSDADAAGRAAALARRRFRPNVELFATDLAIAEAWATWAGGDQRRAIARLQDAASDARRRGADGDLVAAEYVALRLGDGTAARRLVATVTPATSPMAAAQRAHAAAFDRGDGHGLVEASELFLTMGAGLLALDALAHAAVAFRDAGLTRRATAACAQVRTLQSRCEGAVTAATLVLDLTEPLTPREAEICRLAGEGLTNNEIAHRLVVSRRTVENHLGRAFAKLGINRRHDLPRVLGVDSVGGAAEG